MPYIGNIVQDFSVSTAMLNSDSVTSIKVLDGTIVNADINDSAAIAMSKLALSITNSEVNASAAIAGSKISPIFSSHIEIQNASPKITFTDTDNNPDHRIQNTNGTLNFHDVTNDVTRLAINTDGHIDIAGNLDVGAGIDVTGAITGTGDLTIDTNTLHVDSSNNRVGIGTSSPVTDIHTVSSSDHIITHQSSTVGADIRMNFRDSGNTDQGGVHYLFNGNSLKFITATSERMRIDSSGRIYTGGVSTTPTGDDRTINLVSTSVTEASLSFSRSSSTMGGGNTSGKTFRLLSDGSLGLFTHNSTEDLRINSSGKVGIGTSSPATKLHVSSSGDTIIRVTSADGNAAFLDLGDASDPDGGRIHYDAGSNLVFNTASSERMRIDSSGKVGIGTSSPIAKFDVTDGTTSISFNKTNNTPRIDFKGNNVSDLCQIKAAESSGGGVLQLFTKTTGGTATERMRIDTSGKVGIGTSSPEVLLEVEGSSGTPQIHVVNTATNGEAAFGVVGKNSSGTSRTLLLKYDNSDAFRIATPQAVPIKFETSDSVRMLIDSSGRVGIGVTDPDQKVEVAGTVAANDLMVGRSASQFPIIQRHVVSSGSQDFTICAGAGLSTNTTSSPVLTDAIGGAAIRIGAGDPTSDTFGGGIRYFANGSTSPNNPGTGNQHVFYRRHAADTFREAVRITHTGHLKASTEGNYVDITGNYHESFTNTNNQHIHWFQHSGNTQAQQFGIRVRTGDDGNDSNSLVQCSSGTANAGLILRNGSFQSRNNSFGGISDIKLKENIVDAKSQWDDIKAIKFRNFNFKDNPTQKMLGVVAQEIELVSAGLVEDIPDRDPDTNEDLGTVTKHVKSSILYMKAMKCLQEAMAKIEVLETEVAALKAA